MTTHPINPGTKMYLIESEIKGHKYWIRTEEIFNDQGVKHPGKLDFEFVGIIDNASEFSTLHKADKAIRIIQPHTRNHLNAVEKPKQFMPK